jgi:hypothetical protein
MKRILILLFIAVTCLNLQAQNKLNLKGISSITNYGIDYTLAKVLGGNESAHQYWCTYADINELFIEKPKMYDIGKRLGIPVEMTSLEAVNEVNKKINPNHIKTEDEQYMPTQEQIAEAVQKLPIRTYEEKYGIVTFCLFMNNKKDVATYQFVVFNTKTREIIEQWTNSGNAFGLNLKSYWGYSVYSALKKIK